MTETLGDELLVYDERNNQAHSLRREVQAVWKLCDGRRSTEQIATALGLPGSLVAQALWELGECGLLEGVDAERIPPLKLIAGNADRQNELIDRRAMLRRTAALGGVAALAAPLITTVRVATAQALMVVSGGADATGTFSSASAGLDALDYSISPTTAHPSGSTGTVSDNGTFYFQADGTIAETSPFLAFGNFVAGYSEVYIGATGTSASYTLTDLTTPADSTMGTLTAGNSIYLPVALGDDITVEVSFG